MNFRPDFSEAERFGELLRGRRVVIVGPANTTKRTRRGDDIDSYDFVVRINSQFPVRASLSKDIGSRCDILFHCCNGFSPVANLNVPEFANLKFVWYQTHRESPQLVDLCREHGVPCAPHDSLRETLSAQLNTTPNTGTIAIAQLAATELEELHVTGFSFYETRYYGAYHGKGARLRYWLFGRPKNIVTHVFEPQRHYFRELLSSDRRITVDRPLQKLIARW